MNSDVQIAGDPLAIPHLLPPVPAHPSTVSAFAGLARAIAADRDSWAPLVQYDATSRWYHRLRTGPGYEVWLLSWVPGQGSGAHDHGRSSGVLTVLQGALTERVGARGVPHRLRAGAQRVFAPGYVHDVVNDSLEPAVSLHIYFPGLTEMPLHPTQSAESATATLNGSALGRQPHPSPTTTLNGTALG
ncbi:cysteine dioxygenase [Streptomyces hygroscopicus]|uniref:cysteine dioxygenase n=2 Tax=Streptomyces hygroscopicus TaxID=1912 RepID=UPI000A4AD932|nr:cysteine dioxygenase family protein [Streptomyces hygroscopicus]